MAAMRKYRIQLVVVLTLAGVTALLAASAGASLGRSASERWYEQAPGALGVKSKNDVRIIFDRGHGEAGVWVQNSCLGKLPGGAFDDVYVNPVPVHAGKISFEGTAYQTGMKQVRLILSARLGSRAATGTARLPGRRKCGTIRFKARRVKSGQ